MAQNQSCILIVEDTWNDLVLISNVLDTRNLKGQVIAVHNARKALDFISGAEQGRHPEPVAILMDLGLPDMPGQALISQLRLKPKFRNTPIIIFSDLPVNESEKLVHGLNVQSCHQKPSGFEAFEELFLQLILPWAAQMGGAQKTKLGLFTPQKADAAGTSE